MPISWGDDISSREEAIKDVMAKTGIKSIILVQADNEEDIESFAGGRVYKDGCPKEFLQLLNADRERSRRRLIGAIEGQRLGKKALAFQLASFDRRAPRFPRFLQCKYGGTRVARTAILLTRVRRDSHRTYGDSSDARMAILASRILQYARRKNRRSSGASALIAFCGWRQGNVGQFGHFSFYWRGLVGETR